MQDQNHQKHVGANLRSLNNLIGREMEKRLIKSSIDKVTVPNAWILGFLKNNQDRDIFQKDLEEEFGITRSTASKVINLMVQKGYIERKSVSHDARLKKLILTEKAAAITIQLEQDAKQMEMALLKDFSDEEVKTLLSYIERMKNNVKGMK